MPSRWSPALALVAVATSALPIAHADRREASIHAQLVAGVATTGYATGNGAAPSASALMGGLGVRASYATHNDYQYDAALTLLTTSGAAFDAATFTPPNRAPLTGPFTAATQLARLDAGTTLRLGVAYIPTARLAFGAQTRRLGAPTVMVGGEDFRGAARTGRASEYMLDLVGVASIGFDHRINRRLIIGAAIGASYAVPLGGEAFRTVEIMIHVSRYHYPRWD